ncbi:protein N-terminal glutamine amidohydrolase [Nymphaea colorata]|nr:protein N-terminal glutamine amidohydrolase [Nymphaea colorata]
MSASPSATLCPPSVRRGDFAHTPCYCEENVYLLCKQLCTSGLSGIGGMDLFVVFISNDRKQVPLWHQRASVRTDGLVLWDYHVVCIQTSGEGNALVVWDLDSTLPFPVLLAQYVFEAIQPSAQLYPVFRRLFRVVHAPLFLHHFASDRRHMKDADGNWISPPPTSNPIVGVDGILNNLDQYMTIRTEEVANTVQDALRSVFLQPLGVVVSETQLEEFFTRIPLHQPSTNQLLETNPLG